MLTSSPLPMRTGVSPATHLPDPKGPGIAAVPPLATGKNVSMTRWPVISGIPGASFWVTGRGTRTTHFWTSVSGCSPAPVLIVPIRSRIV